MYYISIFGISVSLYYNGSRVARKSIKRKIKSKAYMYRYQLKCGRHLWELHKLSL